MRVIAVIPARGSSKGIPRKNLCALAGKPLLLYSIEASLAARCVQHTVVSTEDEEIAELARGWGAEVITRPVQLAADDTATEPVVIHALNHFERQHEQAADLIVLLQPTSPIRRGGRIDEAVERLTEKQADSLVSVCPDHGFFWARQDGRYVPLYDYQRRKRRQDLAETFRENGSIYVTKRAILLGKKNRLGGKVELLVMSPEESIDIDHSFDLWLAEQILLRGAPSAG